jgi:CheY-like chemotaxis protein
LELKLSPQTGRVKADRAQIEQVLLNLVLNARDAMPHGGDITIETADVDVDEAFSRQHPAVPAGRYVTVSIKDTGLGMSRETQSHLFEPFFTTKEKGKGVGLGLSTAYSVVKQSGGHIWAYSELGVGSRFTVYLPRYDENGNAVGVQAARPDIEAKPGETVLLVEDEASVRTVTRRFLERLGYTVLEAASGQEAIRLALGHKGPIHLLLTDVVMPYMSGREVVFQITPQRPETKVLYMSGHTEDAIFHHGVLGDGVPLLRKPFTREALGVNVRQALDVGPAPASPA